MKFFWRRWAANPKLFLVFGALIGYLCVIGASSYWLQTWQERKDRVTHDVREVALLALSFSEENYHTQMEVWEYVYEPNAKRLQVFNDHMLKFDGLFAELKEEVAAHEDHLQPGAMDEVRKLESAIAEIRADWRKIIAAVQRRMPDREVRTIVFAAEKRFDNLMFNKRIATFAGNVHSALGRIEQENQRFGHLVFYVGLAQIAFAIGAAVLAFFYVADLEHRSAEQQRQLSTAAKFAALGEMAGGIAHEINNPLAAIKTYAGQMQDVLSDQVPDTALVKDMAVKVEKTTDRIAKIVTGMRSFSRDGSKDAFQPFSVKNLLDDSLSLCVERFRSSETRLEVAVVRPDLRVEGRETEVSQVVLNLLNNAHDAISGQKNKWIKVAVGESADFVEIMVTDSGNGIPKEVRERIFEPFFTTKPIGKGTGMGLSIAAGIIRAHKGELSVDASCVNTRFVIRLPKKQVTNIAKAA